MGKGEMPNMAHACCLCGEDCDCGYSYTGCMGHRSHVQDRDTPAQIAHVRLNRVAEERASSRLWLGPRGWWKVKPAVPATEYVLASLYDSACERVERYEKALKDLSGFDHDYDCASSIGDYPAPCDCFVSFARAALARRSTRHAA